MAKSTREEAPAAAEIEAEAMTFIKTAEVAVKAPLLERTLIVDVPTPMLVTFDRWFSARQFKAHWKGGMRAFVNTSGKKTVEEWDAAFKNY